MKDDANKNLKYIYKIKPRLLEWMSWQFFIVHRSKNKKNFIYVAVSMLEHFDKLQCIETSFHPFESNC